MLLRTSLLLIAGLALGATQAEAANPQVDLDTSAGKIRIELYPDSAPKSVENFLTYVKAKHYDGTQFHRVIPGFMNIEQRLDLRHPKGSAQVTQMQRVDSQWPRALGHDDCLERTLLNAVLRERAVFRQQVVARGNDRKARQDHRAELTPAIDQRARRVAVTRVHARRSD